MTKATVLIVKRDPAGAVDLQNRLRQQGYETMPPIALGQEAISQAGDRAPDLVLMDIELGGALDGIETAREIRTRFDVPVVFVTSLVDEKTMQRARQTDPLGYLVEPFSDEELWTVIEIALFRHRAETAEREQRVLAEALRETAAVLSSSLELENVLDRILANVERVIPHDAADIMLVEEGTTRIVRYKGHEQYMSVDQLKAIQFEVAEAPNLHRMSETGQPLIIPDVRRYNGWVKLSVNDWIRSYAGVPIRLDDEVIGFLNLNSGDPGFFTEHHIERLRIFADQIATAIRNVRLYQTINQHVADLEERNRELNAFGHMVAHDLASVLQVVVGYSSYLVDEYKGDLASEVATSVQYIDMYAQKMADMLDSMLLLAHLREEDNEFQVEPVATGPVVEAVLERYQAQLDEVGFTVEVAAELPPVLAHEMWLEEVFANLVDNAIKYIGSVSQPHLEISAQRSEGMIRFEVRDNGMGIDQEKQEDLFQVFKRLHGDQVRGSGLGLSIVKRIIDRLGGSVGVESGEEGGSIFWFELAAAE